MRHDINLLFLEPAPCDDCAMQYKCDEGELACGAFSQYVLYGRFDKETAKIPTERLFHKIFKEDDLALKKYMKSMKAKENWGKK